MPKHLKNAAYQSRPIRAPTATAAVANNVLFFRQYSPDIFRRRPNIFLENPTFSDRFAQKYLGYYRFAKFLKNLNFIPFLRFGILSGKSGQSRNPYYGIPRTLRERLNVANPKSVI